MNWKSFLCTIIYTDMQYKIIDEALLDATTDLAKPVQDCAWTIISMRIWTIQSTGCSMPWNRTVTSVRIVISHRPRRSFPSSRSRCLSSSMTKGHHKSWFSPIDGVYGAGNRSRIGMHCWSFGKADLWCTKWRKVRLHLLLRWFCTFSPAADDKEAVKEMAGENEERIVKWKITQSMMINLRSVAWEEVAKDNPEDREIPPAVRWLHERIKDLPMRSSSCVTCNAPTIRLVVFIQKIFEMKMMIRYVTSRRRAAIVS